MQSYNDKSDDYFAHARKEIAPWLPKQCGRVLEIGCGAGATLGWLRQQKRASLTVGVEIAEGAARSARSHADEVHCLDFERDELALAGEKFDLILCLDVLEHMVNPWQVVDRLVSQHLAPGGTLLVSLPNVRHHSVLLPLLLRGRWDYQDAGLLDRTHLRFFTRGTAIELLSHPGLQPARCMATGFDWPSLKGILNTLTFGVFREFFTYQYFLVAEKRTDGPV
jgi:SAM-dependent methyltransferase